MKKVWSAVLALGLCVTIVFAFSGCMFKNPVDKLSDLLEKKNYKMEMDAYIFSTEMKVDGDIIYSEAMGEETYEVKDGDKTYVYTKDLDDEWTKEEKDDEEESDDTSEDVAELLVSDAWEKVEKGEYELIDEDLMEEFEIKEAVLKIEDDEYELTMETEDGIEMTITFSEFGEVELEVPEVD